MLELITIFHQILIICGSDENFTTDEKNQIKEIINFFSVSYRDFFKSSHITPKFHNFESHLSEYISRFGGLKIFSEQTLERSHREKVQLKELFYHIKDKNKLQEMVNTRKNLFNSPDAMKIVEDFENCRKRKKEEDDEDYHPGSEGTTQRKSKTTLTSLHQLVVDIENPFSQLLEGANE